MNSEFKNKLYKLGEYLLSEGMENEFLRLVKLSQEVSSGVMPDFSWFEDVNTFQAIAEFYEDPDIWKERFLDLNSDKILEWDVKKELGYGAYGVAYELTDGRVLKIFSGPGVLEEYRRIDEAAFNPEEGQRHDPRVYDYGVFRMPDMEFHDVKPGGAGADLKKEKDELGYSSIDLGYAVIEKLNVPSKEFSPGKPTQDRLMQIVSDFCRKWWRDWYQNPTSPPPLEFSDEAIIGFMNENNVWQAFERDLARPARRKQYVKVENLRRDGIQYYGMPQDWVEQFMLSNFKSLLRGHGDTKPENMGYRGETPVFFDAHRQQFDYEMPEDIQRVRNWDVEAQLALLSEYLDVKTAQIRQNFDYSEANDMVLTPELAKQYGLEHLLPPPDLEGGRYGEMFGLGTKMRQFVNEFFFTSDSKRDAQAKQQWVDEFLDRNSDVIAKYDPVEYLGSGAYADAWETDDGRVIKFIRNDKDLGFYKEQQDALHSGEGSQRNIMVYDMGTFDVPWATEPYDVSKLKNMSWVVMEKLNPLRDLIKSYDQQLQALADFLQDKDTEIQLDGTQLKKFKKAFAGMREDIELIVEGYTASVTPNTKDARESLAEKTKAQFLKSDSYQTSIKPIFDEVQKHVGLPANWMENIIHAMVFHLLGGDDDLHSGNVGFRGNQPVYYDPSNRKPQGYAPRTQYSGPSVTGPTDEGETIRYDDNTIILDEEDETLDEEARANYSNKTFDWEHT